MATYQRAALAALVYTITLGLCALCGSRSGRAQEAPGGGREAKEVLVMNPATRPVPATIQGVVPVRAEPGSTVGIDPRRNQVCIDPACNKVGIDPNSNTVTLSVPRESPIPVREVDHPAKSHWVYRLSASVPIDDPPGEFPLAVPAGTRWVIENVNYFIAKSGSDAPGKPRFSIDTSYGTGPNAVFVPHLFRASDENGGSNTVANQLTRLYSDAPAARVVVFPNTHVDLTVDGYLVAL